MRHIANFKIPYQRTERKALSYTLTAASTLLVLMFYLVVTMNVGRARGKYGGKGQRDDYEELLKIVGEKKLRGLVDRVTSFGARGSKKAGVIFSDP